MPDDDRTRRPLQEKLARYVLSPELTRSTQPAPSSTTTRTFLAAAPSPRARVMIELSHDVEGGVEMAKTAVLAWLEREPTASIQDRGRSRRYLFATLDVATVQRLAAELGAPATSKLDAPPSPVVRVWPDPELKPLGGASLRTVKADACHASFGADGKDIVWAVADSGIESGHPHFAKHQNLALPLGLAHKSFLDSGQDEDALKDSYGHGTHVAGVIAGETPYDAAKPAKQLTTCRDERDTMHTVVNDVTECLSGVAPQCKLVSLKVLDDNGAGYASALIAALEYVAEMNEDGRRIRVQGVNLSVGYPFDAEWYAAGHSPLCEVVNHLASIGVCVVVAAGNDGSAFIQTEGRADTTRVGIAQSINDPGNADGAITVGSTHAEAPHTYGVSYFSSRGPTADGRRKPDLVAPGERILSCASTSSAHFAESMQDAGALLDPETAYFREDSGTSMAAPHVSGAIAAIVSVRREYCGRARDIKDAFLASCTDLKRHGDFQGAGLLDMFRAIQSI